MKIIEHQNADKCLKRRTIWSPLSKVAAAGVIPASVVIIVPQPELLGFFLNAFPVGPALCIFTYQVAARCWFFLTAFFKVFCEELGALLKECILLERNNSSPLQRQHQSQGITSVSLGVSKKGV